MIAVSVTTNAVHSRSALREDLSGLRGRPVPPGGTRDVVAKCLGEQGDTHRGGTP